MYFKSSVLFRNNNQNDLVVNENGQVKLEQHFYGYEKNYKYRIPLNQNVRCAYTLTTNTNKTVGKGGDNIIITTSVDDFHFYKTKPLMRCIYVKALKEVNKWHFWEHGKSFRELSTCQLFTELNEEPPQDREGYTVDEWCSRNEKQLLSQLRYHQNDIDGLWLNDTGDVIGIFEAKKTMQQHNDYKTGTLKKHLQFRQQFTQNILGMELKFVTDKEVFKDTL